MRLLVNLAVHHHGRPKPALAEQARQLLASLTAGQQELLAALLVSQRALACDFCEERGYPRSLVNALMAREETATP